MRNSMRDRWVIILLLIGFVSIGVRVLINFNFHQSALLYILGPYLIAVILASKKVSGETSSINKKYSRLVLDSLIVMLGSSIVLFEGFLCVIMFMPLYFGVMFFYFMSERKAHSTLMVTILPIIIIAISLEGVMPGLSFNRENVASGSKTVYLGINDIKLNMQKPINLKTDRPALLNLFPMPTHIKAESLSPGDVHEIYFDYYRWFFTNVHEGHMLLEISEVGDNHVKTKFLEDTSYLSNYIKLKGTLVTFEEINPTETVVTINVHYTRSLDPAWYFSPLQQYAVSLMAEHLISSIMERS